MESSRHRAWEDTERFRHTPGSFWGLEIVGASVFGLGGGYVGFLLTPQNATPGQNFVYPAIGGVVGVVLGLVIVFGLIFAWNLLRAPYKQRDEAREEVERGQNESKKKIDQLQSKLDDIGKARPNIEFVGTENIRAVIRNVANGAILGEPAFTQVKFANNPSAPLQAVDATNVMGHIHIYTQNGKHLFNMIGRWSETREEALGAQPTEMEQITIPANGRPNPMDIVLKYNKDQDCYGHTNRGRRLAPTDWRDMQKRLPVGTYFVKVHLRGSNVDKEFWFNLVNKGAWKDIELQVSTIVPLIPDKAGSQT